MSLQYISDNKGQTTGVFIPIEEWNNLKNKYKGIEEEELEIPPWQVLELDNRVEEYRKNPTQTLDFNQAIEDIEKFYEPLLTKDLIRITSPKNQRL